MRISGPTLQLGPRGRRRGRPARRSGPGRPWVEPGRVLAPGWRWHRSAFGQRNVQNQKLQTVSIHSGRHVDPATGAVTTPLYTSTTFERDADGEFSRHYFYSPTDNPNPSSLEQCSLFSERAFKPA
jgi:Cys/Met metabolism PLP-dependent enzyme